MERRIKSFTLTTPHIMKKIILCLSVLLGFTMNGQWFYNSNNTGLQTSSCTASGSYSTAMGRNTTASGYGSIAMGEQNTASGNRAFAMGYWNNLASGDNSVAMGEQNTASGSSSVAMGRNTTASANYSTAIGYKTTASGNNSFAIGQETTASDFASLSIGSYNSVNSSVTTGGSATAFDTDNAAFVVGNGYVDNSDIFNPITVNSDAFVVYFNGNATLASNLTVGGTLVVNGKTVDGLASVTENGKTGKRFSTANPAHYGNIGSNAVDLSISLSNSTYKGATGDYSTAIGDNTTAAGTAATALGSYTYAAGSRSTTMGDGTSASDYASVSIGRYNSVNSSVTMGGSATAFNTANAAFVIGNGTLWNNKSDAFVVYFNGNATLAGDLTINSDARLKDNIQPLGSTLEKLHQIEGKTYTFLKDEEHTPKIGVLAQEVQVVFPELVTEGADGILSVNYQGLVPVLINAINEQELKMSEQELKMSEQDAKIAALEAQNAEIKELKEMVRVLALQQSQTTSSVAAN